MQNGIAMKKLQESFVSTPLRLSVFGLLFVPYEKIASFSIDSLMPRFLEWLTALKAQKSSAGNSLRSPSARMSSHRYNITSISYISSDMGWSESSSDEISLHELLNVLRMKNSE